MLNVLNVDSRLLSLRAESVGFGDTQEYLHTTGPTSPLRIKNHRVMIPNLVTVERLEGVHSLIMGRPMISWPWGWKI